MGAVGETVDESGTVGWDVDARRVVYLLHERVSLLVLVLARRTLPAFALRLQRRPIHYLLGSYLCFVLVDGVFGLRVFVHQLHFL